MIGAIIGDIAGSRFEFNRTNRTDFVLFTPQCDFTDDTICTIAIADAIMNRNNDFRGALLYWCNRYTHPMGGYVWRFLQWLQNHVQYDSIGNGAAMRVSPVAWLCNDMSYVMNAAKAQSEVSHNHPEGIRGAQCVAMAILLARNDMVQRWKWSQSQLASLLLAHSKPPLMMYQTTSQKTRVRSLWWGKRIYQKWK